MKPKYLAIILAILVLGWGVFWWLAQGRFADALDDREARLEEHGVALSYKARSIGGFPFRLIATYENVVVTGAGSGFGWGIQGPRADLIAMPWNNAHVILDMRDAETALSIDWTGADGMSREYTGIMQTNVLQMSISAASGLSRISLDMNGVEGDTTLLNIGAFDARDLQFHMRWPEDGAYDGESLDAPIVLEPALRVKDLVFKGRTFGALGPKLDALALQGALRGEGVPGRDAASLNAWRDSGGTLDMPFMEMRWGPMAVDGSGTVAIDEDFRPIGAFSLNAKGMDAALATLEASTTVSSDAAELLRITFDLLGAREDAKIQLPITLQDGVISVGPVGIVETGAVVVGR